MNFQTIYGPLQKNIERNLNIHAFQTESGKKGDIFQTFIIFDNAK